MPTAENGTGTDLPERGTISVRPLWWSCPVARRGLRRVTWCMCATAVMDSAGPSGGWSAGTTGTPIRSQPIGCATAPPTFDSRLTRILWQLVIGEGGERE